MRFVLLMVIAVLLTLTGCSNVTEEVEVFVIEVLEDGAEEQSPYVDAGYKKVNSITTIEESRGEMKSDIKAIEDFYDTEGNYLRTLVSHLTFDTKDMDNSGERIIELQEPAAILVEDESIQDFYIKELTEEEREQVRDHVLDFFD